MGKEKYQQQNCDATDPEKKMLGQLWGIDFFFVHFFIHDGRILRKFVGLHCLWR
jgi:hypothetical protein